MKYCLLLFTLITLNSLGQCPLIYDGTGTPSASPVWISCNGNNFTLNFASPTALSDYDIDWGDGSSHDVGVNLNANTTVPHTYSATVDTFVFTLVTTSPACTVTGLVVMEKPVNASIQIPIGGTTTTCAPASLQFTNASTDVSATTVFTWDFGDGTGIQTYDYTNGGQTVTHSYAQGSVNCQTVVTLTAENYCSFGTPTSAQFNPVQIYDLDDAEITPDNFIICWPQNTFNFTNSTNRNCVPQGNVDQRYEYWNLGDYWGLGHDSIIGWSPWPPSSALNVAYPAVGNYNITLLDSNRCGIDSVTMTVSIVNPPTAGVSAAITSACAGSSLTFNNTSSAGYSYQWNFGDNGTYITTGFGSKSHTYNVPGTYTVTVVAFIFGSASSCSDTAHITVNIFPNPIADFTMNPSGSCDSITVDFTDQSVLANSWNWNFGNGNTSISSAPPTQTYTSGVYTVSLQVTAANSCTNTKTQTVTVYSSPLANFNYTNACVNSTVSFTDATSISGDPLTNWAWDFGDSGNSTSQNPSHVYAGPGPFNITLTVNTAHCSDDTTISLSINPLPTAGFSLAPSSGCSPVTVAFTNSSSGASSYEWDFGNGQTSTATDPTEVFTNSITDSTFTVTLIATTNFGCTDTLTDNVSVFGKPQANFNHSVISGCAPVGVSFTNSSLGATSYQWDFGAGQGTSTATNPTNNFSNTSSFVQTDTVTLIALNAHSCSDTLSTTLTINPQPLFGFSINPDTGCSVLNVSFPAVPGAVLYQWDLGDGTNTTGSNPTHNYTNPGLTPLTFTVQLIATNTFNCKDTSTGTVYVKPRPTAGFTLSQTSGCPALDINFANTSVGATSYTWSFGDGGPTSAITSPAHSFDNTSTLSNAVYSVQLKAENIYGCADSITQNITVFPSVVADFTDSIPTCPPAIIQFSNNSQGASSYQWNFGDSQTTSSSNPSHTYSFSNTVQTNYTVQLVATSSHSCRDTMVQAFTINPKPSASYTDNVSIGCPALSVSFANNSVGASNNTWNFGDGTPDSIAVSPSYVFDNTTSSSITYPVKLVVDNIYGCKDSVTHTITVYPFVAAAFTDVIPNCPPGIVQFTNNSQGASSYAWNFGDSQSSLNANPSHTFANNDTSQITYNVQLIATNSNACKDTIIQTVVINPAPTASFTSSSTVSCPPVAITFTNSSTGITSSTWSFGDGSANDTNFEPSHVFDNTSISIDQTYNVKLLVENSFGCKDSTITPITIHPTIIAQFTADTPICAPVDIQFHNFCQGAATYNWDLGDGTFSTQATPIHTYQNNGPGNLMELVQLVATSGFGCTDTFMHTYVVYPTPQVNFTATPATQYYPATSISINNLTPNASSYTTYWDFDDDSTSSQTYPLNHTFDTWGTYNIMLLAYSPFCRDSVFQTIEIIAPKPIADFNGTKKGCRALSVSFTNLSQYENAYLWDFGDGNTSTQENPTHTFNTAGVYDIKFIAYGDGGSDTLIGQDSVTVYDLPQAAFVAAPTTVNAITDAVTVTNLSYSPGGSSLTYLYDFGDNSGYSADINPSHIYTEGGDYEITLYLTNSFGCRDTFIFSPHITVNEFGAITVPNAFTPNQSNGSADGTFDSEATNNDIFHPVVRGVKEYELFIYSRWGELLFHTKDVKQGWDGYYKGKLCTQDIYIWKIIATTVDNKNINEAGDLLLLKP